MDQTSGGQCPLMSGPRSFYGKIELAPIRLWRLGQHPFVFPQTFVVMVEMLSHSSVCGLSVTTCKQVGHIKVKPYICNSKSGLIWQRHKKKNKRLYKISYYLTAKQLLMFLVIRMCGVLSAAIIKEMHIKCLCVSSWRNGISWTTMTTHTHTHFPIHWWSVLLLYLSSVHMYTQNHIYTGGKCQVKQNSIKGQRDRVFDRRWWVWPISADEPSTDGQFMFICTLPQLNTDKLNRLILASRLHNYMTTN